MIAQGKTLIGRKAQTKMADRTVGKPAIAQIGQSLGTLFRHQLSVKETRRLTICFINAGAQLADRVIIIILGHGHTGTFGKELDRLHIVEVLDLHHKGDDIAPDAASETVKRTVFRIDVEGWCFFAVKRA